MEVHSNIWNPEFTVILRVLTALLGVGRHQNIWLRVWCHLFWLRIWSWGSLRICLSIPSMLWIWTHPTVRSTRKRLIIINHYYEIYTYFISFLSLVFNRPFLSILVFLTILGLTGGLIEQKPNWLLLLLPSPIGGMKISTLSLWIRFRSLNATASQSSLIQMVNEWA